ncbi:MAG: protein-methionine-sulfoxide reductase heme-binding subunit MsrQ [Pseudomonadota bacterium]
MKGTQRLNRALCRVQPWMVYGAAVLPPAWFLYLGLTGGLGVEPIKELEHRLGLLALQVFLIALAVRPLRDWTGVNLFKLRRALGVITFAYVALHFLVWLVLDVGILSEVWADIVKRPYITVGLVSFVLITPLAFTSNNLSVRKLGGKRWRNLHKLTYPAAVLAALHYVMLAKGFQIEPLVYLAVTLVLLVLRFKLPRRVVAA